MATDFKGMSTGVRNEMLERVRMLLISLRISSRRSLKQGHVSLKYEFAALKQGNSTPEQGGGRVGGGGGGEEGEGGGGGGGDGGKEEEREAVVLKGVARYPNSQKSVLHQSQDKRP
jgi:hypothetical protein